VRVDVRGVIAKYRPNAAARAKGKTQYTMALRWHDGVMYDGARLSLYCTPLGRAVTVRLPARPPSGILKLSISLPIAADEDFALRAAAIVSGPDPAVVGKAAGTVDGSSGSAISRVAGGTERGASVPSSSGGSQAYKSKWVPIPPRLRMLRFCLAWAFAVVGFLVFCLFAFTYGVVLGPATVNDVMLAWLASLVFTWGIIEPGEVALIVFSKNNEYMTACRNKLHDYGFI